MKCTRRASIMGKAWEASSQARRDKYAAPPDISIEDLSASFDAGYAEGAAAEKRKAEMFGSIVSPLERLLHTQTQEHEDYLMIQLREARAQLREYEEAEYEEAEWSPESNPNF